MTAVLWFMFAHMFYGDELAMHAWLAFRIMPTVLVAFLMVSQTTAKTTMKDLGGMDP